jgi:predicted nucleotidyltransferase
MEIVGFSPCPGAGHLDMIMAQGKSDGVVAPLPCQLNGVALQILKERWIMKREDIVRLLRERKKELVESYQIVSLSIFGSVVRGEATPGGKVNILVKFARPTGLSEFLDLKKHLEALLGCRVSLGKPGWLKPQFKTLVLQEAFRVF